MDPDLFSQLYETHANEVLAYAASRIGRDEAEDAAQEIWRRVFASYTTKFDGGHFRGWLFQITRNYIIDYQRASKRRPEPSEEAEAIAQPAATTDDDQRVDALKSCYEKLSAASSREATVVQGVWQGREYSWICEQLSITAQQAYDLFRKAKQQLKSCIERELA